MSNKLEIKPTHLFVLGLTIIILGILIPSFFISAFSTIGLAVIIGLLILLSAYAFFAINLVRLKGKKTIKWLLLPLVIVLLLIGGLYTYNKHSQYLADKIYSVSDTVKLDSFDFKITNTSEDALTFNTKDIDMSLLNCEIINYDVNWDSRPFSFDSSNPKHFYNHDECSEYNSDRDSANSYISDYDSKMTVSYQVEANDTMRGKDLHIEVLPDSGRTVVLNAGSGSGDKQYSFMWNLGKKDYVANPVSDFGGDLNKGLTRKGTIGFDLKKTEQTIDLIVKYHDQIRTIRISRQ